MRRRGVAERTEFFPEDAEMAMSKITEEQKTQICAMAGVGCSLRTATRLAGCADSTVRSLLRRDRAFENRYRKSLQSCELMALRHVQLAGEKNWRAAAWLLERMRPNDYGSPKPDIMTPHQAQLVLSQMGEIKVREVKNPEDRRRARQALREVMDGLSEISNADRRDRIFGPLQKPAKRRSPA